MKTHRRKEKTCIVEFFFEIFFLHGKIISAFPHPTDKKDLPRFLGILNFYWRVIKGAVRLLRPQTEALKGKSSELTWNPEMNQSFASVLANVPTLVHPHPSTWVSLSVYASGSYVGAVLKHQVARSWAHLVFYFKKLSASVQSPDAAPLTVSSLLPTPLSAFSISC